MSRPGVILFVVFALAVLPAGGALADAPGFAAAAGAATETGPAAGQQPARAPGLTALIAWREEISPELRAELVRRCATLSVDQRVPEEAATFCQMFRVAPVRPPLR